VVPINIKDTIDQLVKASDQLGHFNLEQNNSATGAINGQIIKRARTRIAATVNQIYDIIDSLPEAHHIDKRQIGLLIAGALGGIGTLMGLFNGHEIHDIVLSVGQNRKKINNVIDILQITNQHQQQLDVKMDLVGNILQAVLETNPGQLSSEVEDILSKGVNAAIRITNLAQQAQNKRIAIDTFPPQVLKQIFQTLEQRATSQGMELLITKPSDLLQIDVSYLHGYGNLTLVIHAPMVSADNKLNLYQYIPFPLSQSLGANVSITPMVNKDLIAVGKQHQYKILGQSDLAACTKMGQNFLCEGRSVLRTDMDDSCIGALFLHHLPGVLKHCQYQLGQTREHVFQTGPTQWLVSTPEKFSSVMQCEKDHETIFINQISSIEVKPGCKLYLKSHVIQPDTNLRQTLEIKQHSWQWDIQQLFPTSNLSTMATAFFELQKTGTHIVSADDIRNLKFTEEEIAPLMAHPNVILIVVIILCIGILIFIIGRIYYKRCIWEAQQPLDEANDERNRLDRIELLQLRAKQDEFEYREAIRYGLPHPNRPDVLTLGSPAPDSMANYTVDKPTPPIHHSVPYPTVPSPSTMY
jgi:hypothetical protein